MLKILDPTDLNSKATQIRYFLSMVRFELGCIGWTTDTLANSATSLLSVAIIEPQ
jgi:hypothetical protein